MNSQETGIKNLLETSRRRLLQPFSETQRRLLFLTNVFYLVLVPVFLVSEKMATGHFVPHPALGWVYGLVSAVNLLAGLYNLMLLRGKTKLTVAGQTILLAVASRFDNVMRWASIGTILAMSFCNMIGLGNPSSDAILTDFGLGCVLIVLVAIVLGQRASLAWTAIVIVLLCFVTFVQRGYSYQYNYLTPTESTRYEKALSVGAPWALSRQAELKANSLNPPRVSRYFNTWLVFLAITALVSYFCMGVARNVLRVVPTVAEEIKEAIDTANQVDRERERERSAEEQQRLLLGQEALRAELKTLKAQINPHFLYNTLYYFFIKASAVSDELADSILKMTAIMRYSMQDEIDRVPLNDEINFIRQYIDLHRVRDPDQFYVDLLVDGLTDRKEIPPFLLIGLVENAFKHGKINEIDHPLRLHIRATDTRIQLFTSNKKNLKKRVESNGIGLTNLRRRLELTYPQRFSFEVRQTVGDFSCELTIDA